MMRKIIRKSVAIPAGALILLNGFAFLTAAQEQETPVAAAALKAPTIDQSLEMKGGFNPQISPDGKRVVYEVSRTNWEDNAFERDLWIADVPTGESHALTTAKKSSTNAEWSADAKWIAFLS